MKDRFFTILVFLIFVNANLAGQWVVKHVEVQGQTIYDLKMLSQGIGMAVGGAGLILRSDDYGENWTPIPCNVNRNFFQIGLISADMIVARGDNEQRDGSIYKSVDGGYTWDIVYTHYSDLFSLHFFNDSVGLASGTNAIIRSADGGSTWTTVYDIPVFTNYKAGLVWVDVASDSVAYAGILVWNDGLKNITRFLLKSVDAGMTWEKIISLGDGSGYSEMYFYNEWNGFFDWDFLNRTLDGGMTWDTTNNIGSVVDISMPSPDKVYTVNHPVAYIQEGDVPTEFAICSSEDGGLTWLGDLSPGAHLEAIHFINDSVGFVAGDHSLIMKTEHGGGPIQGEYPWHLYTSIMNETDNMFEFTLYPNPAQGTVQIDFGNESTCFLRGVDINGRIVIEQINYPSNEPMDIQHLSSGMYFILAILEDGAVRTGKLLVK